ncbi:hypothetical protein QE394_001126 [Arthrobacter sp. SORGH_AS 212]|nr:hypothetical protein [Arthrobacter sp. SORGH_AS_0212]
MRETGTERVTGSGEERVYGFHLRPGMSEREFQAIVVEVARLHGYELAYHTHDSRRSAPGFPDLVLVSTRRVRVLFRELKTDKGRVSPDQRTWIDGLTAAGMDAGVWRPADLTSGRVLAELKGRKDLPGITADSA